MTQRSRPPPRTALVAEPRRYAFDAAVRILTHAAGSPDAADSVRFRSTPGRAYPTSEVAAAKLAANGHPAELTTAAIGLAGAAGVLPSLYTEVLAATLRGRSRAVADFYDLLSHRVIAMFAGAAVKYRLNRSAEVALVGGQPQEDRVSGALLAFTGFATPHLVPRLSVGAEPLLHYSGFFAGRPRSAERLEALLSDWLGRKVEVVQFAGAWLPLPPEQRTSLAVGHHSGAWNRLSVDAAVGVRAWDAQARIVLRIGPLDYRSFAALLPGTSGLRGLVSLVRAFLGFEIGFAVNPILAGPEIPPLRLAAAADPAPRLGWNTWMPAPAPPVLGMTRRDGDEAVFEAEIVEAEETIDRVAA